ncbi:hypothetical protein [Streptomyces sp. VNUA24]|uniref:SCO2400 family protein n=1 Tax=Streptomyces sp. VNUA24 TaxID=3031131 RepID=UPI0023B783B6|nr:hypothetical protein [Streptomyces sp. VNUA24]WEH16592.1 hypothetical protein PYR72_23915 [Streptomyces sp. VNUA24]
MDYCSSCRRHLNGALVCPGCGAYAPDIAPAAIDSRVAPAGPSTGASRVPAVTWDYGAVDGGAHGGPVEGFPADTAAPGTGDVPAGADADVDVDLEGVPEPPRGRAARRRQLARWKKNQRRAVVATTVALVGGGLTVLGMDRQSTDRTQAATAPDADSLGALEEQGSQRGRTPDTGTGTGTETDEARRTADAPTRWTPSGDTSRDRSAANRSASRASRPDAPRTAPATPSAERARTGDSGTGGTATDTPADGATTPPPTDAPGSSADTGTSSGSGADTGTGADTGSGGDTGSANGNGSGTGGGNGTGAADGSGSDTATTSPSGLCLLGIVCVN